MEQDRYGLKEKILIILVPIKLITPLAKFYLLNIWVKRIIVETGAGQHGVATATVASEVRS